MNILMIHPHDVFSKKEPWTIRIKNIGWEFLKKKHQVKIIYFPLEFRFHQKPFFLRGIEFIPRSRRVGIKPLLSNILAVNKLAKWAAIVHFQ